MALRTYKPTTPSQRQLVLVDKSDLGFHVKVPDGWKAIPPAPGDDPNLILKYTPAIVNQCVQCRQSNY